LKVGLRICLALLLATCTDTHATDTQIQIQHDTTILYYVQYYVHTTYTYYILIRHRPHRPPE
jgi:hypothetical protein